MMGQTEAIVRTVVRHLLEKPGMLPVFISTCRDAFPEKWVLSGSLVPRPHRSRLVRREPRQERSLTGPVFLSFEEKSRIGPQKRLRTVLAMPQER
jgi:hypothetical protein